MKRRPRHDVLCSFGLVMSFENDRGEVFAMKEVIDEILTTIQFLSDNKDRLELQRFFDAFKVLLLTLKTHYPSLYSLVNRQSEVNLQKTFELENISGRDIKLRNITLSGVSAYFKKTGYPVPMSFEEVLP